jgi:hypothetical protein
MSGFLGRLISGASAREPKLRPFAGPVFAPAPAEQHPVEEFAETVAESAEVSAPRRRQQLTEVADRETQSAAKAGANTPQLAAPPEMQTQKANLPPRTQPMPPADVIALRAQTREERRTADASAQRENLGEEIHQPSATQEKASAVPRLQELLVPASSSPQAEASSPTMQMMWPARPSATAASQPAKAAAQNPRGPQRAPGQPAQPPDIQVHIGRIEVVAVPPAAAPQSKPRPRVNSTSLQDYLRQTGGRR